MKKFFAVCLTLLMICSLVAVLAVSSSAVVSPTAPVYDETEPLGDKTVPFNNGGQREGTYTYVFTTPDFSGINRGNNNYYNGNNNNNPGNNNNNNYNNGLNRDGAEVSSDRSSRSPDTAAEGRALPATAVFATLFGIAACAVMVSAKNKNN